MTRSQTKPTPKESSFKMRVPITPRERIVSLDVLRGFALLGILLVNVLGFSGLRASGEETTGLDRFVLDTIGFLAQGKFFIAICRCCSALDLDLQWHRLQQRGLGLFPAYGRRLAFLFILGILHTHLEPAEVLALYALCGAVLIFFKAVSSQG